MDCIFCKIVNNELPSEKVYEDEWAVAFLDINPVRPGHVLLIPKAHHKDLLDTPAELLEHLIKTAKKISKAVMTSTDSDAFNLTHNNGSASGQIIFHAHFHIIPRKEGDGLSTWPHSKYTEGEASRIAEKIRSKIE